jgi:hypothetical protein
MNLKFMDNQIKNGVSLKKELDYKQKFYNLKQHFINFSRIFWSYSGYTNTTISWKPWHDCASCIKSFDYSYKKLEKLLDFLENSDGMTLRNYSIICLPIKPIDSYKNPLKLYNDRNHFSWARKLYESCEDKTLFLDFVNILYNFLLLQVETYGKFSITAKEVVRKQDTGYYFDAYCGLLDRILDIKSKGLDPEDWLSLKFNNCVNFLKDKDSIVRIRTLINNNGLEPSYELLRARTTDLWRDVRQFLGLSYSCTFPDGYIPKGWCVDSMDKSNLDKVVKITGDGYYYKLDGSQRRGRRHYSGNSYFVIKCTPENFGAFRATWHDPNLYNSSPTWDEYSKYGAHPNYWDAEGIGINGMLKPVRWRAA